MQPPLVYGRIAYTSTPVFQSPLTHLVHDVRARFGLKHNFNEANQQKFDHAVSVGLRGERRSDIHPKKSHRKQK